MMLPLVEVRSFRYSMSQIASHHGIQTLSLNLLNDEIGSLLDSTATLRTSEVRVASVSSCRVLLNSAAISMFVKVAFWSV